MYLQKNIPTPSFGVAPDARKDKLDELIENSNKNVKVLSDEAITAAPDLRSLKDAFLETNPMFQEMLHALETFDASMRGEGQVPSKYDQAVFAAVRTMLRECLFTKNAGMRKNQIERVYSWYQEKNSKNPQGNSFAVLKDSTPAAKPLASSSPTRPKPSTASAPSMRVKERRFSSFQEQELLPTEAAAVLQQTDSPRAPHSTQEGLKAIPPSERIKEFKMRNLRLSQMLRQGIPLSSIRAAEEAVKKRSAMHKSPMLDDGLLFIDTEQDKKIHELWLRKREEEEMERRSEKEVQEAMAWWAMNRAKIEEEVARRQESVRFASQTASLHARPTSSTAPSAKASAHPPSSPTVYSGIDSDSDDEGVEVIEDLIPAQPLPEKFLKVPQLKSPYDGLRQAYTPAGWPQDSLARPISARLAGHDPAGNHLFSSPSNKNLLTFSSSSRPHTAGARVAAHISAYDEAKGIPQQSKGEGKGEHIQLHGFFSPHSSRPTSSYRQSQAPTVRQLSARPRTDRPSSAVSSRAVQLTEVDRIKRAFAKTKISCPLNVIEKALVVPEDRSYAKCLEMLPRPGWNLIPDPVLAEKKKATKGKKGGKTKGKKGKKKK
mmetsp:Transcript_12688/g.44414  ORF Transcript_12688/g.44414 Transcript_12688/m.44414 type:complete len:602 (-) Transcript_12688:98-1903(-)